MPSHRLANYKFFQPLFSNSHHQHHQHQSHHNQQHQQEGNMRIILDDNDIYLAGQAVCGTIVVDLVADVPLTECALTLNAVANVGWTENPGLRDEGRSVNVHRKLLEVIYELEAYAPDGFIPGGHHEIPFEFFIPDNLNLPSSFQSRFGSIVYTIDGRIGEHARKREILVDVPITKNLYLTVGGTSEKDFGVLSFASGSISMQATLDKKGYFRGEEICVNLLIDNNSTASVKPRVSFYQTQIYMTGERHKTVENSLTEAVEGEEVLSHTLVEDVAISVTCPVNIPLSIKSELITLKYFVHVTLDIPLATDLHINLPLIITSRAALEN